LPGTCVYVYAGSQIPTATELVARGSSGILTWQMGLAFVLLGIFPFVVKRVMSRVRPTVGDADVG